MSEDIVYTPNELELLKGLGYTDKQLKESGVAHSDVCLRLFRRIKALEEKLKDK